MYILFSRDYTPKLLLLIYYYASSTSGYVVSSVLLSACVFRHQLQLRPADPWERDREGETKGEKNNGKGGGGGGGGRDQNIIAYTCGSLQRCLPQSSCRGSSGTSSGILA